MSPKQKINEIVGVAFLALAALLALSLASYSGSDPAWNVSSSLPASNFAGRLGAWTSDLLFQTLGLPALFLPLPLLLLGYRRVRGRTPQIALSWATLASAGLVASCAALLALSAGTLPQPQSFASGGVLGHLSSEALVSLLNRPGALLVALSVLIVSLLAATSLSLDAGIARLSGLGWLPRPRLLRERLRPASNSQGASDLPTGAPPIPMSPEPAPRSSSRSGSGLPEVRLEEEFAALVGAKPNDRMTLVPEMDEDREIQIPPLDFLRAPEGVAEIDRQRLFEKAEQLTNKYSEFSVSGNVVQIHPGPVVTTFEFKPDPGIKYTKVTSLDQDLCLGLKAESIRIDRIPGKNTVGVEVPNDVRQTIFLREILASPAFQQAESPLTVALGKRINGNTYIADLSAMPHLLIAGSTGSGKSVALNGMVCSILYKSTPSQVRFIMVDPKRLELGLYTDIPHLLTPIVTDPKQAANALSWAVSEMEQRYKLLARHGVRNIAQFNKLMVEREMEADNDDECLPLPYIVIIIDELADLMMTSGKEVEAAVTRLAQMARAIGIHLILATQRPSVDVITGLIKANFPCRMSFRVSSRIDSRTILDASGAEQLLGMGDMLFLPPGTSRLVRLHGPYVSEKEIARITGFLKEQGSPHYQEEILIGDEEDEGGLMDVSDLHDDLYEEAARFVVETRKASTSLLQRRFRIGYGRAARLLDIMEHEGLISPPDGSKARQVLVASDHYSEIDGE